MDLGLPSEEVDAQWLDAMLILKSSFDSQQHMASSTTRPH